MVYMWSMSSFVAPVTWVLVAYFLAQTVVWATNRHKGSTLVGEIDLRLSMSLMSLGMAYMFAIMQLGTCKRGATGVAQVLRGYRVQPAEPLGAPARDTRLHEAS